METVSVKGHGSLVTAGEPPTGFGDGVLHFGERALTSGAKTIPFDEVEYALLRRELFVFWFRWQLALKAGERQYWLELRGKPPREVFERLPNPKETETDWHWFINLFAWVPLGSAFLGLVMKGMS
jgi:hypothetical protein